MNIYMFHYVNDKSFNYYHFDCNEFENIIKKFIQKGFKFISYKEFNEINKENLKTIENCVLLTFDDGTIDHYSIVYPILKKYNISGLFFLCSNIGHNEILDVNLIHQLISHSIFDDLYDSFKKLLVKYNVNEEVNDMLINTEYDDSKMLYFKQMLQFILPNNIKNKILLDLAQEYNVSIDYNEYYINLNQIKEMKANGMEFGFHTVHHKRLEKLNYDEQEYEIMTSYKELLKFNIIENDAPFSYPFGSYNEDTKKILKENKIKHAFIIDNKEYSINSDLLTIPRYDCNVLKRGIDSE